MSAFLTRRRLAWLAAFGIVAIPLASACAFDTTLRAYLNPHFWYPLAKRPGEASILLVRPRLHAAFAGRGEPNRGTPALTPVRWAYQSPDRNTQPVNKLEALIAAAHAASLTPREREELDLLDAKFDIRLREHRAPDPLVRARDKLTRFLSKARTPEYRSEARGWLAHVHHAMGDDPRAGKMYLAELRRVDTNLSRETLMNSLAIVYGYDGRRHLARDLAQYFDHPANARFAIETLTNPRSDAPTASARDLARARDLLLKHASLFQNEKHGGALASLGLRVALRSGDASAALAIAEAVPAGAPVRSDPDFLWMLGAAHYLARSYAEAETALLQLFDLPSASVSQRAAAAYGLCGVYMKLARPVAQLRFAAWLHTTRDPSGGYPTALHDRSLYFAVSGYDLGMLLDGEAPVTALRAFVEQFPTNPVVPLVKYSLAVRLARDEQYAEAAALYDAVRAPRRAERMRRLAALRSQLDPAARFAAARYLADHVERIYFNDRLWHFTQRYALVAERDPRLAAINRDIKDGQEELWRAHLLLRGVVQEVGRTPLGLRAATLAIECTRRINTERFGREQELARADRELTAWLQQPRSQP